MSRKRKPNRPDSATPASPQTPDSAAEQTSAASTPASHPHAPAVIEEDEVNVGLLAIIGAFSAVALFLIVVLLQAWFYNWKGDLVAARGPGADSAQTLLARAIVEQQEQINHYHWVNRETKVRAIPIQRAMELVVQDMRAEQAAPQK